MPFSTYLPYLQQGIAAIETWQDQWPPFEDDDSTQVAPERLKAIFAEFTARLRENYPHFHPLYAGQMIKPPHPVSVLGYLTAMLINPNNHALDSSEATSRMEKECIQQLGRMFGYATPLGHLTGGGTVANLEALWVAQQLHPDKAIAFSDQAHYTHRRMCDLIGAKAVSIPSLPTGQIDLDALRTTLATTPIGTVVATLGSTALGALDELEGLLQLQQEFSFRIHVDTAYGGFYAILAETDPAFSVYGLIRHCDSVVIDPHKQGLQPYGCGCVLFKDPSVGHLYRHDSPYTYFTSDELHLGEISLECSRSGASAAALWLTLQCFPLSPDTGFGPILKQTRTAALTMAQALQASSAFELHLSPQLDIVTYFPVGQSTAEISQRTDAIFKAAMTSETAPLYLAKLKVNARTFTTQHPHIVADSAEVTLFRSCLLKPEHAAHIDTLMTHLHQHAAATQTPVPL